MILDIDPKVDYAFKRLFGSDETRAILIGVLNSVLNLAPGQRILEIEILNPFNPKEAFDDKLSILDIKARDESGRQFNIEMQMNPLRSLDKRLLYYCAKYHTQQLHEGQDYLELKPTISITFLNHVRFPRATGYHLHFQLLEVAQHFPFTEDIDFHVFELPKFTKGIAELASDLDIWLYFLRHAAKIDTDAVPAPLQQPLVLRALEVLKMLTQDQVERERYEARRKAQLDYTTGLKEARLEGREEGIQKGREEGIQKGREEGIQKGREEGEKIGVIHFCQRLLNHPATPAEQLAGLSLEELTRLADDLQAQVRERR